MTIRKQNIEFLPDGHTYTVSGELFTGVTTILEVRQKPFLKWWTVKEAVTYLADKQEEIKKATPEEYVKILDDAKEAHTVKSKEALVSGKLAHLWIEQYIKEKINKNIPRIKFP